MSARLAFFLSATLLATGCEVTTELGKPCVLLRRTTEAEEQETGRKSIPIKERELAPGQDFISFGVTECEELICVRDADFPPNTEGEDPDATGYCSTDCVEGSDESACEVTDPGAEDGLSERMTCRSLLLDQQSLERLRQDDPALYRRTFGETLSPYFCAGALAPRE